MTEPKLYCPGCAGPPIAPYERNDSWGVGTACLAHPDAGILGTKKEHQQRKKEQGG